MESMRSLSDICCIYRVPNRLRQLNEKAYIPRVVSVGPLHKGKQELKATEEHKRRYLRDFLQWSKVRMEDCIRLIEIHEMRIRNCYAETIQLSSKDFVKLILLDATFIIVLLLKGFSIDLWSSNDRIFNKPWLIEDVRKDLLLLENRLPFFILDYLFKLSNIAGGRLSIIKLTHRFFKGRWDAWVTDDSLERRDLSKIEHFLDLFRIYQQPPKTQIERKLEKLTVFSAATLHRAGVKFVLGSSKNLFEIKFDGGVLEMPQISIEDDTEMLLRNLQAFEQCHCSTTDHYVNPNIFLMAKLLESPKDVELLAQKGIIENLLRNNEGVSNLFHRLDQENAIVASNFCFRDLVEDLNAYCKNPWHKWKAY